MEIKEEQAVAEFGGDFIFNLRKQPNGERWPVGTKLYTRETLEADLGELLKDAARYRWMAERTRFASVSVDFDHNSVYNRHRVTWFIPGSWVSVDGQSLDDAIDQAMSKSNTKMSEDN